MFASDRLLLAESYCALLATEGVIRGLIGPREAPRLWERHLLNSAVLGEAIPAGASVCDIGSGAGLPGLVVAIARPDVRMCLVEPLLRRTTFLSEVVADLGLSNVEVVRGRADDLHGVRTFDIVTSRAVAPLDRLLGWSMPLVGAHGALVAMKGSSAEDEIRTATPVLQRLRAGTPEVLLLGAGSVDPQTTVVRVPWADPTQVGLSGAIGRSKGSRGKERRRGRRTGRP